jgi:hypothetical protein
LERRRLADEDLDHRTLQVVIVQLEGLFCHFVGSHVDERYASFLPGLISDQSYGSDITVRNEVGKHLLKITFFSLIT